MQIESPPADRQVVTRKQEEEWAAKHSRITRILGWCLIVGFVFTLVSAFFTDHLQIDILMLAGGCAILNGSQAWLRFFTFMSSTSVIGQINEVLSPLIRNEPLEISRQWVDYHDLEFWQWAVLPIGLYLALATLCITTLRSRQLVFWTKICKRWVAGFVVVVAVIWSIVVISSLSTDQEKAMIQQAAPSLEVVEDYARAHGAVSVGGALLTFSEKMEADPLIRHVSLSSSPNGSMTLFKRHKLNYYSSEADYQKFIKSPTGEWILIKVDFEQP
ncbi:hypothetical protein JO972_07305 [Verrucomicrobiaceae bacterium 5K15]|uniref:Uncharacterized protein n=1 Tax=Oceaniferula flava TaxID=2800421 RepID=A0AAE2VBP4_9BACT|nr:hypothetical protein [Oceaniferula flavus]MBK1854760.1 hypothetical protein [Oceaniferula flavus]MBM1136066.1 hypothetical protein [Oceaniferula flavus]